jgi:hypothetical protein
MTEDAAAESDSNATLRGNCCKLSQQQSQHLQQLSRSVALQSLSAATSSVIGICCL